MDRSAATTPNQEEYLKLTYRAGVDVGWGCTYRTVQMLVGNVAHHRAGVSWEDVATWFVDNPDAPFSLKNLAHPPLRWASPTVALAALVARATCSQPPPLPFAVHVLTHDTIAQLPALRYPALLCAPVLLGTGLTASPEQMERLTQLSRLPSFAGMVCGQKSRSFFALRLEEEVAHVLDPHSVAPPLRCGAPPPLVTESLEIPLVTFAPSMAPAWYFSNVPSPEVRASIAQLPLSSGKGQPVACDDASDEEYVLVG